MKLICVSIIIVVVCESVCFAVISKYCIPVLGLPVESVFECVSRLQVINYYADKFDDQNSLSNPGYIYKK